MAMTAEEARERKLERQKAYSQKTGYASQKKYNQERGKIISFRVFAPQDNDIIDWLNHQPNKAGYLKELIRSDMAHRNAAKD